MILFTNTRHTANISSVAARTSTRYFTCCTRGL